MSGFEPYLALRASAGSGKTFALSVRYIALLYLGAKPSKILTLTFTNKAAAEMKSRIFNTLKNLENKDECEHIARQVGISKEELLAKKDKILEQFLQEELAIYTIDAFFAKALRKFSLYAGLMPDFSIESEVPVHELLKRFIFTCKKTNMYNTLLHFSLQEDKKLSSVFELLEGFFDKENQLNMEAWKRQTYLSENYVLDELAALQKLFEKQGAKESLLKTLQATNITELAKKKFWAKKTLEYWQYKKHITPEINASFEELQKKFAYFIQQREQYILGELAKLFLTYKQSVRKLNKEQSMLRFFDVTSTLYELLNDEITKDFLYFRLDGKIDHLLIDEFQDTSVMQYKILEPLMEEIIAGIGIKEFTSLFFVGDTKQSIYRFRGGAKELFSHAKEHFNITEKNLDTNFRSAASVVEYVNEIFQDKIEGYLAQKVKETASLGYVEVIKDDEVGFSVCQKVQELLKAGAKPETIAILVHKNSDAQSIKELLYTKIKDIKVQTEASLKLIHVPLIAGILDFLKYAYFGGNLYKQNFLVAIGKSWSEEGNLPVLNLHNEPTNLIKQIVNHFHIFADDLDVIKLIEVASNYDDIESFLFASEYFSQESKQEDNEGIKVLTIHKSKGLEFEHVVVCDRLSAPNNRTSSFLYEYEGIELKSIYQNISSREYVDNAYSRAKQKEQHLGYEDSLNMYYVAFTRAKNTLMICAKETKSAFELLELQNLTKGSLHVKEKNSQNEQVLLKCLEYEPRYFGVQANKEQTEQVSTDEQKDYRAINYGLALHYCLEVLVDFDMKGLKFAYEAMRNRYGSMLDASELEDIYKRMEKLLENKEFQELLYEGVLYKEQPIAYNGEKKQIDLLIEKAEEVLVIDYKSSQNEQNSHINQVLMYKSALQKVYTKPIKCYLCYIRSEEILLKSL